ncbi:MAG: sporulation protein [Clostridia bacterium]|nr:sporulation protein [Clostridia bacterium]MBO7169743.1 sporulation protein [Clostridia bacterium]
MQPTESSREGHSLSLRDRESLSLSGVEDVLSFDEAVISCRTTMGDLVIEGSGLRIADFSSEKKALAVVGTVNGLYYENKRERGKGTRLLGWLRP